MQLKAQAPLRMSETVFYGKTDIASTIKTIHGLKKEVPKIHLRITRRFRAFLRIYEFEFVSPLQTHFCTGFRTYTYPIDTIGRRQRSVRLDGHFHSGIVQRINEMPVKLEERLSTCADDERSSM